MMTKNFHAIAVGLAATALLAGVPATATAQTTPYLGDIIVVGFDFCPRGYADANGAILSIAANQALYSLYGTAYGGDGRTTFALPDLRGRVPIRYGQGPGLEDFGLGARFGSETQTMTAGSMPSHTHAAQGTSQGPTEENPAGNVLSSFQGTQNIYASGAPDTPMASNVVGHSGGSQPFSITAPTETLRYCVATQGIFPSRS
jgi:microcystin-dependent protein